MYQKNGEKKMRYYFMQYGNNIVSWGRTNSEKEPKDSEWENLDSPRTHSKFTCRVKENGNYYIWFKDEDGNITNKMFTVQYVDSTKPTITSQLVLYKNSKTGFEAKVSAQDTESGLSKINWYYKKSTDTDYQMITDTYTTNETGQKDNTEKIYKFTNLESNITYSVYAEIYDIVENFVKTTPVTITTLGEGENTNDTNTNDLIVILRHISASKNTEVAKKHLSWLLTEEKLQRADINKDGKVDVIDVTKLLRHIAASKSNETAQKHPDWLLK